jgi:hypothetical protein
LARGAGPLSPDVVEGLLVESGGVVADPAADLRHLRDLREDLHVVLAALDAASVILASDVVVLRRSLASAPCDDERPRGDPLDPVTELPRVLGARPWGRGWSVPPDPEADPGIEMAVLVVRSAPLWSLHDTLAGADLTAPAAIAGLLEPIEAQLVTLSSWRSAVQARLVDVRMAIVRAWTARVDRSLDTTA